MIIVDIDYKHFSEVNHLNKNFIPGVNKLKLTIDAISSSRIYQQCYPIIAAQFNVLFPNLKKHLCCYEKLNNDFIKKAQQNDTMDSITDIIHLIEHVIIDIQCSVSKMKICSGITCNYYEPRNRYDIFVECIDDQIGYYGAQLAIELVIRMLNNDRFVINYAFPEQSPHLLQDPFTSANLDFDYPAYMASSVFKNLHLKKN
jgi:hypothetical protein